MKLQNNTDQCPYCGLTSSTLKQPENVLSIGTVVEDYQVGMLLMRNQQSCCYAALQRSTGRTVLLEEFYPSSLMRRDGERAVAVHPQMRLAQAAELFLSAETPDRTRTPLSSFQANGTAYRVYAVKDSPDILAQAEALLEHPIMLAEPGKPAQIAVNGLQIPPLPPKRSYRNMAGRPRKRKLVVFLCVCVCAVCIAGIVLCLWGARDGGWLSRQMTDQATMEPPAQTSDVPFESAT